MSVKSLEAKTTFKNICGDDTKVQYFESLLTDQKFIRFFTDHTYAGTVTETVAARVAAKLHCKINTDENSITVIRQCLIPLDSTSDDMEKMDDNWTNEEEKALGLPVGESCTSGSWTAGHSDTSNDCLLTEFEADIITEG